LDIFIDFTVATHFSHSDQAAGHEQHMLSIIVGRNRTSFYPLRWRASNPSNTIFAVLVYDRDTGSLVRFHRLNETSSEVNILMMIPESYLTTTRNISVVIHHSARGFINKHPFDAIHKSNALTNASRGFHDVDEWQRRQDMLLIKTNISLIPR
jgi:hypothetical protein